MEAHVKAKLYSFAPGANDFLRKHHETDPEQKRDMEHHLRQSYGGSWRYNEVIGYIRLHFLGDQIRGEWWQHRAKQIVKTRTKQIEFRHWKLAHELRVPAKASSKIIYSRVLRYLELCKADLKKWHLDTSEFEFLGQYVNWKRVYEHVPTKLG
jgi:hypothetical protein